MLHLKTDAELRFFVENPTYYQAELVAAARQELRRRQPSPPEPPLAPPAAAPAGPAAEGPAAPNYPAETDYPAAPPRQATSWLLPASVAGVVLLAALGFWGKARQQPSAKASAPRLAQVAARPPAAPIQLDTALSAPPLPTYSADGYIAQALTKVPASEKANEQVLAQYQAISRLFWVAQQPSAHLIGQAQQGTPNPLFAAQTSLVLGLWHDFDRTLIYHYDFGPVMGDHFNRMKTIARRQRISLAALASAAAARQPFCLTDTQLVASQRALPRLLAPLQASPGAAAHP